VLTTRRAVGAGLLGPVLCRFYWRWVAIAFVPVLLFALLAASNAHAALPSNCTQSLTTVTCSFSPTGSEQTFAIPVGVSSVHVVATGASGGTTFIGQGGAGAQVASDLAVTSGGTLFVEVNVGGGGASGPASGGSGGGESDVRTCSASASCGTLGTAQDPRLIVAGGGGGGGRGGGAGNGGSAGSGAGGTCTAGTNGTAGNFVGPPGSDGGGLGGTCIAGGLGGIGGANGTDGTAGAGGTGGGGNGGGGGGAGYFGGGGGAGSDGGIGSGGGGGGGSSFGPAGSVFAIASTGPSVVISYTVTVRSTSTSVSCSPGTVAVGTASTCTATVTDTDAGTPSTPTGTVSFGSSGAGGFGGNPCTLDETSSGVASCSVSYTPDASNTPTRTDTITATYGGDSTHAVSSGTTAVTTRPTSKADCQNGGWQNYGFANQGQCIQFVGGGLGAPQTNKADCKHGGWRNRGFTSQGDCVAFVATGGKNEPGKNVPPPKEP
jgi:hypothetical protein